MKDNKEQIMNTNQVNEEVVTLYSTYYYDHVQRIEQVSGARLF